MRMDKEHKRKMETEYFEYQGQRYYAGSKFKMISKYRYYSGAEVEAAFTGYYNGNPETICVEYKIPSVKYGKSIIGENIKRSDMEGRIIEILSGNYYMDLAARKKYFADFDIPELTIGWMLYIFCMIGGMIFNGYFTGGWLLMTIIFFVWRHKIKEENYYYE